ncbi:MAG: biopolymer transporter ExbD [Verrucomicrobiae bacterium]|nr:biopolymer transporter ExbD [Verrucomicrobiae bacterium]
MLGGIRVCIPDSPANKPAALSVCKDMKEYQTLGENQSEDRVCVSPMIDLVFILIIFFVVAAVFVDEWGVPAETPGGEFLSTDKKPEVLEFRIDDASRIWFNEDAVSLETVRAKVAQSRTRNEDIQVMVHAEAASRAGLMIDVLDQVRLGGIALVSLALISDS